MKKNILINLSGLTGERRAQESSILQNIIVFMWGFVWPMNGKKVQYTDQPFLFLNFPTKTITYANRPLDPQLTPPDSYTEFNLATTPVDGLLKAIADASVVREKIDGVDVIITPIGVKVNGQAFLASVEAKAQARRRGLYGNLVDNLSNLGQSLFGQG